MRPKNVLGNIRELVRLRSFGPPVTMAKTVMTKPIRAAERLTLIIYYLAYGDSQQSMSFSYRIANGQPFLL